MFFNNSQQVLFLYRFCQMVAASRLHALFNLFIERVGSKGDNWSLFAALLTFPAALSAWNSKPVFLRAFWK